jgi:hypothetical protein
MRQDAAVAAVFALGVGILGIYTARYPVPVAPFDLDEIGWLQAAKLLALAKTLLLLLCLNLAAYGLGEGVHARLRGAPAAARAEAPILFGLAYGWLALSYLGLLLAALGWLHPVVLAAAVLLPAGRGVRLAIGSGGLARLAQHARTRPWDLVALCSLPLLAPFLAALGPDVGWDGFTYHLALPERYLDAGGLVVTPFSVYSVFPGAMEMLYTFALALDGPALAVLLHFEFGVLCLVALAWIGGRFSGRCAVLAPIFLLSEPLLLQEMSWANNDLGNGFYALMAVAALLDWREGGGSVPLLRSGIFAGACMATRYLGATVPFCLALALLLTPRTGSVVGRLRAGVVVGALASLFLVPWLLRNGILTGNPVAPSLQSLFYESGREYFDVTAVSQTVAFRRIIGMGQSLSSLLLLPWNLTMETLPGRYDRSFGFLISPIYLVSAVALVPAFARRRDERISFLLKYAAAMLLVWFVTLQEARYLLPVFPVLALAGAWAFDELLATRPGRRNLLLLLPGYALLIAGARERPGIGRHYELALGPTSHQSALEQEIPAAGAARFLRGEMSDEDRVFLVGEARSYLFRGLDYIPYQPPPAPPALQLIHRATSAGDLHCRLAALGVTHVLLDEGGVAARRPFFVEGYGASDYLSDMRRLRELLADRARLLHRSRGVDVARLGAPGGCPPS